jgi:hypothetical protein
MIPKWNRRLPVARAIGVSRGRVLVAAALLCAASAAFARSQYTWETDPVRLGLVLLREGKVSEAKVRFEEALSNDYEIARAHYGMAEVHVRQGSYATRPSSSFARRSRSPGTRRSSPRRTPGSDSFCCGSIAWTRLVRRSIRR